MPKSEKKVETITCYYMDENDQKIPFEIPQETCDHCSDDLFFIEADYGRASVGCFSCDFQEWVYPPGYNEDGKIEGKKPEDI
jgi:hypothetical protein